MDTVALWVGSDSCEEKGGGGRGRAQAHAGRGCGAAGSSVTLIFTITVCPSFFCARAPTPGKVKRSLHIR